MPVSRPLKPTPLSKVPANGDDNHRAELMAITSLLGWHRMGAQWVSSGALKIVQSGPMATGDGGGIANWIHLEAIQVLAYHASAVIVTLVLSAVVGYVIQRLTRND